VAPVSVAIVGCGRIFPVYVRGLARFPERVRIAWCTDIIPERAQSGAALTEAAQFGRNEDMLADPSVAVVINLTPPTEHAKVIHSALNAGKHVFTEKPLAITTAEAAPLVTLARERGLALGSAADTAPIAGPSSGTLIPGFCSSKAAALFWTPARTSSALLSTSSAQSEG
jgi:predicted dehydrogenase